MTCVVGRAVVGARQGSHVVAVLGPERDEHLMLELAPLRVARETGPRASHRNIGQGRQVREAAHKVLVLPVLAGAVLLVVRARVKHALVGRVDGSPSKRRGPAVKSGVVHDSVDCDFLTIDLSLKHHEPCLHVATV